MIDLTRYFSSSIVVRLIRFIYKKYCMLEQGLIDMWYNSRGFMIFKHSIKTIAACCKNCVLGKITEVRPSEIPILDSSVVGNKILIAGESVKVKLKKAGNSSYFLDILRKTENELKSNPLRMAGTLLASAVFINELLVLLIQIEVNIYGWLIRALFLSLAFAALKSDISWDELSKESIIFNKIKGKNE